ncbi:hypothetical protein Btru_021542 [Bulinus truncatus]|nr:hypothetical protein Btru_021542 [Bulinus truncatus]
MNECIHSMCIYFFHFLTMMSIGYLLLICGVVLLSITLVPSECRRSRGHGSRTKARTSCLRSNDSCEGVKDGLYQLCSNCSSGQYIRCSNGSQTIETCPKVLRKVFFNWLEIKEFLVQTRFDSYTRSCEVSSLTCWRRQWRRPSTYRRKFKTVKTTTEFPVDSTTVLST